MKDNLIKFKKKSKISDSEINGLFLGLVKLIKKVAMEDASQFSELEKRQLNENIQENLMIISQKELENEKLKKENAFLKSQIRAKNQKILHLSCLSAQRMNMKDAN